MGDRYVEVSSEAFEKLLSDMSFSRTVANNEVVYARSYRDNKNLCIKVYTSISIDAFVARGCGEDAIRICAVWDNGQRSFGVGSFKRVYRTGSQDKVFTRVRERIEEATERCAEWLAEQVAKNSTLAPVETVGEHVGAIGDTMRFTLKVSDRKVWKDKFLFTMKDAQGHTFVYWSGRDLLRLDETYDVRATIKSHNTFRGVRQTEITEVAGKRVI